MLFFIKEMAKFAFLKKLKLSEGFVQLLIVIAGVFIGMLLTEWNANRKLSNKIDTVLDQIKIEIKDNKALLESSIEYKRPFFIKYDSLIKELNEELRNEPLYARPFHERLPGWRGIGGGRLDNAMFETAKFSDVLPEVDIELVKSVSKVYNHQDVYNKLRESFINQYIQLNSASTYNDALFLMGGIRQELGGYEVILLKEYDLILNKLESRND